MYRRSLHTIHIVLLRIDAQVTFKPKLKESLHKLVVPIEVPQEYRASQYDHTVDEYIKKKLSDRMFKLTDGSRVQRDLYSSFLLYNIDLKARTIDRAKCIESFNDFLLKQQDLITYIKVNKIKVANSGIKL